MINKILIIYILFSTFVFCQKIKSVLFPYINWDEPYEIEKVRIVHIADGDTALDNKNRWIRFLGIDTPELAKPHLGIIENDPGAIEATEFTVEQIENKTVLLVIPKMNRYDHYDRLLALIFYEDKNKKTKCLNWELLKYAYAKPLIFPDNRICVQEKWEKLSRAAQRKTLKDYLYLSELCLEEGLEYDAIEIYKSAIKKFPQKPELYIRLAQLYKSLNMLGFAVDVYLACLEKFPELNFVRRELAFTYEKMVKSAGAFSVVNYKEKAISEWTKLLGTEYDKEARKRIGHLSK